MWALTTLSSVSPIGIAISQTGTVTCCLLFYRPVITDLAGVDDPIRYHGDVCSAVAATNAMPLCWAAAWLQQHYELDGVVCNALN